VTPADVSLLRDYEQCAPRLHDGRDHPSAADAYPLDYGDSIGFWSGHTLVIHTSQVKAGIFHRNDPQYSDSLEAVEVWRKTDPTTVQADVWVYDPVTLEEPWHVQQTFKQVPNPDGLVRIGYWYCGENPNNAVERTDEGTSQFSDFTFTDKTTKIRHRPGACRSRRSAGCSRGSRASRGDRVPCPAATADLLRARFAIVVELVGREADRPAAAST
jgi:hypothetical protein